MARSTWSEVRCREVIAPLVAERGALLPVLHAVQMEFGWIHPRAVPVIADELNLSRAEVHGVVTFYRDFRSEPPARHEVRICRAEACQATGADQLVVRARTHLGIALGATTGDGSISLGDVFCLGNCALGPSVSVDGCLHGRVDGDSLVALLGEIDESGP
jgi:formate dehydrogenase subunit gamma